MIFGTELWPSPSHQKNAVLTRQLPSLTAPRRQIEWSSVQSLSHAPGGCVPSLMTQPLIRSSLRALVNVRKSYGAGGESPSECIYPASSSVNVKYS